MSIAEPDPPTVFVVDDHADVREGVKQLVESVGLRCEAFTSPREFLERSPVDGPSCLVLDVRLPQMSGLDLQDQLVRGSKTIPIIMITGYGDISMAVRSMQAGAVDFLTKPVPEQIVQFPDQMHDDPEGQHFPSHDAARDHGHRIVRELKEGGYHAPGAVLHVRDETGQTIHSIPF